MSVVNQDAEAVFLLQLHDAREVTQSTRHAVHTLGDDEDAATRLFHHLSCHLKFFLKVVHVVVAVFIFVAKMQTDAVEQTSVCLVVINDNVVGTGQRVDSGNDALIAKIEKICGLFLLKISQFLLKMLVHTGLSRHHTGTHRSGETPSGGTLGINLTDSWMVGQTQIIVQAPAKHFLAVENHAGTQFAFQTGKRKITVSTLTVLPDRTTRIFCYSFKNVHFYRI